MSSNRRDSQHTVMEEMHGVLIFLGVLWVVYVVDWVVPVKMSSYGVQPRSIGGLIGILTMPFLHMDIRHLISNSVPLFILLALLAGSRGNSVYIVATISLTCAAILWALGLDANTNHIGASGLVYGLISYLILSGFLERRVGPLIISIVVLFMFGLSTSTWMGLLPRKGISWEGHAYGAVAGAVVAYMLTKTRNLPSGSET